MPIYTYPLIYAISILVGLFSYKKLSHNKYLKYFIYFLIYTFFSEVVGLYLGRYLVVPNNIVYNTWQIVNFLFFSFFFLSRITGKKKRLFIKLLVFIFITVTLINVIFFGHYVKHLLLNNAIFAKFLVVILTITYFIEVLESDDVLNIKNSLFFWIALGEFLYNLGFLPAFALFKFITVFGMFQYITFILNIIMHSCYITGFIISKKEYNS